MKNTTKNQNLAIIFLITMIITVVVPVSILGAKFDFPDILRQPAANAFALFKQNQSSIVFGYYIFLISSLLFIPLSYLLQRILFQTQNKVALNMLVGLGITTAIFQCIGFVRWIFVMPFLTENYYKNPENQKTIELIYETLNRFLGMSVGEHLGFIAMGLWTICLGCILLEHPKFKLWVAFPGIPIGAMLIISLGEHFGGDFASVFGKFNFLANTLWSIWLAVIAFFIFKIRTNTSS